MQVTLKLFATLMPYLPEGASKNAIELEVSDATTVNQLIAQHKVPEDMVHLVLVNGRFINPEQRDEAMQPGDALAIWPPVAGG